MRYPAGSGTNDLSLLVYYGNSPYAQVPAVDAYITYSSVPEPSSLALLAVGAMGLLARRRRKTQKS